MDVAKCGRFRARGASSLGLALAAVLLGCARFAHDAGMHDGDAAADGLATDGCPESDPEHAWATCDGACVELHDPNNCGKCGLRCGFPDSGLGYQPVCWSGRCECFQGGVACPYLGDFPKTCVSPRIDPHNCGGCGHECPATAACCVDGECVDAHGTRHTDGWGGLEVCP